MSRVIAVVNQKGGVAKTTTVANLGVALAQAGHRCLLVDSDPQGSLTISLGQNPDSLASHTLYEAMVLAEESAHTDLKDVILVDQQGVDLIPANLDLAAAEIDLNAQYSRGYALSRLLAPVRDAYDFILIDCPPQLGILTINALVAADSVLVPLATNYWSLLRGLQLLLRTVRLVQSRLNAGLRIEGLLPTLYDRRTSHHQETLQEVRRIFSEQHIRVFETVIPRSVRFEDSPITGTSAVVYAPNTPGAHAYRALVQEVLTHA